MTFLFAITAAFSLPIAAMAQMTNNLSPAANQGRELAAEILSATPVTNFIQTGDLRIRNSKGMTNIPITFHTELAPEEWYVLYTATLGKAGAVEDLKIVHQDGRPNQYLFSEDTGRAADGLESFSHLSQAQIMSSFAGSDFSAADLGLEFFHWPDQRIIGQETRRMRDCKVLESINPNPVQGSYSRVVTWIDKQTLGIIHAEAYDANGKLLKIFDPKSLKKVNGQWELQDVEIRNVQTHSRTWIRFNL